MQIDGIVDGILPEELLPLINAYLEGRVKQALFLVELENGFILDGIATHSDDFETYKMVGAIESIKRDYMRLYIQPRVDYKGKEDE